MKFNQVARKRGQNTAEYLILLVLVAVGAITMFGAFGQTIKSQIGSAIFALEGKTETNKTGVNESVSGILTDKPSMDINGKDLSFKGDDEAPVTPNPGL